MKSIAAIINKINWSVYTKPYNLFKASNFISVILSSISSSITLYAWTTHQVQKASPKNAGNYAKKVIILKAPSKIKISAFKGSTKKKIKLIGLVFQWISYS